MRYGTSRILPQNGLTSKTPDRSAENEQKFIHGSFVYTNMVNIPDQLVPEILTGNSIRELEKAKKSKIKTKISHLTEQNFSDTEESELVEKYHSRVSIEPPSFDSDDIRKEKVGNSPNAKIRVAMPIEGSVEPLSYQPTSLSRTNRFEPFDCEISDGLLAFEVEIGDRSADQLEQHIQRRVDFLVENAENLSEDIESINSTLERHASNLIGNKKEEIESQDKVIDDVLNDE